VVPSIKSVSCLNELNYAVLHWRKSTHYYGSSGLCFPLHISEPFSLGWQYSAFIFLGVNSLWYNFNELN